MRLADRVHNPVRRIEQKEFILWQNLKLFRPLNRRAISLRQSIRLQTACFRVTSFRFFWALQAQEKHSQWQSLSNAYRSRQLSLRTTRRLRHSFVRNFVSSFRIMQLNTLFHIMTTTSRKLILLLPIHTLKKRRT